MRILYLHQYFTTPEMGRGTRSYEMARRLVARGHEVDLVTSDRSGAPAGRKGRMTVEAGIRVHWLPVAYDNRFSFRRRLGAFASFAYLASRKALAFRPDVVFATSTPLTIAIPGIVAKHVRRCPMVFEVRDLWPSVPILLGALKNPAARRAALLLERQAYRHSTRIVALSPTIRDHIVATGYPADRVAVIPNSSDLDIFDIEEDVAREIRREHPWLGDRQVVLFAGTLGLANGVGYLVHLAKACNERTDRVVFVIIGDGMEFERIRDLARDLELLDRSVFLLGVRPKHEVARWMKTAAITTALFTGPSFVGEQASPNKIFDSFAASRPIATNFKGWIAELAEREGCGLILDAHDTGRAADQLLAALGDEAWQRRARAVAYRLACKMFNRDLLADRLERTLLEAVG